MGKVLRLSWNSSLRKGDKETWLDWKNHRLQHSFGQAGGESSRQSHLTEVSYVSRNQACMLSHWLEVVHGHQSGYTCEFPGQQLGLLVCYTPWTGHQSCAFLWGLQFIPFLNKIYFTFKFGIAPLPKLSHPWTSLPEGKHRHGLMDQSGFSHCIWSWGCNNTHPFYPMSCWISEFPFSPISMLNFTYHQLSLQYVLVTY